MDENNNEFTTVPPAGEKITFDQVPPVEIPEAESIQTEPAVPQTDPVVSQAEPVVSQADPVIPQQVPPVEPRQQYYQQTPPVDGYQVPPTSVVQEADTSPMTVGEWIVTLILMVIPCVNIVMMFVWAFGDKTGNVNRRNFARAELIILGAMIALYILIVFIMVIAMLVSF